MSTVTFPWQHNGLQALSIQRGKPEFSSFKNCYDPVVHSVGVSEHGHYTAQAKEANNQGPKLRSPGRQCD